MRWPGLSEIRDMSELQLGSTGLDCNKNQFFFYCTSNIYPSIDHCECVLDSEFESYATTQRVLRALGWGRFDAPPGVIRVPAGFPVRTSCW